MFVVQHFGTKVVVPPAPAPVVVADVVTPLEDREDSNDFTPDAESEKEVTASTSTKEVLTAARITEESDEDQSVTGSQLEAVNEVNEPTIVSSTTITTTTASQGNTQPEVIEKVPESTLALMVGRIATSPSTLLQLLYVAFALFVVGSLLMSIIIEVRQQRPVQIAYSVALLFLMTGLFYLQQSVIAGAMIA